MITVSKYDSLQSGISKRDHHFIIWAKQAQGKISIENKAIELGNHTLITIGKNQLLEYNTPPLIKGYIVFFDDSDFPNSSVDSVCRIVILYNQFRIHNKIAIPDKSTTEFEHLLLLMYKESETNPEQKVNPILSLLLQTLMLKMEQIVRSELVDNENEDENEEATVLSEFLQLLEANFSKYHKVKDYANLMNVPSRKLNDTIRYYFGVTAKDLISTKVYIETARRLQFTSDSIKEIAYQSGFSSPYHLSHFFTKMKGISPQAYRNSVKN